MGIVKKMNLSEQLINFLESSKIFRQQMKSLNLEYDDYDDNKTSNFRIEMRKMIKVYQNYESQIKKVEEKKIKNKVKRGKKIAYGLPNGEEGFKFQWICCTCGLVNFSRHQAQTCNHFGREEQIKKLKEEKKSKKKSSSKKILDALKTLHDEFDCKILNDSYRGPMEINPRFTFRQIANITGLSVQTVNKWCKFLRESGLVVIGTKKRYFANDPITYNCARKHLKALRLHH